MASRLRLVKPKKDPVYICRLFEGALSTSDYIASNVWLMVIWNECGSYYSEICLGEVNKTTNGNNLDLASQGIYVFYILPSFSCAFFFDLFPSHPFCFCLYCLYLSVAQICLAQRQRFWQGPLPPSSNLKCVTIPI